MFGDLCHAASSRNRAAEGVRVHRETQAARPETYMAEVPVTHVVEADAAILEILTLGKQPVYASDVLNIPSMRIAEKLGFIPHCDLLCGFLGPWKKMRGEEDDPAIPDSSFMI